MKKLILSLFLGLTLIGCSSMQTGQTLVKGNTTYTKLTDSNVFYLKDNISLDEYYSVVALTIQNNYIVDTSKHVRMDLRYYPREKVLYLLFPDYEDGFFNIIKGITFSNKESIMDAEISNLSNVISSDIPNICLSTKQAKALYTIMSDDKPVILRVLSSEGYYDIPFRNEDKKGFTDLLEIYLELKTYNIN